MATSSWQQRFCRIIMVGAVGDRIWDQKGTKSIQGTNHDKTVFNLRDTHDIRKRGTRSNQGVQNAQGAGLLRVDVIIWQRRDDITK